MILTTGNEKSMSPGSGEGNIKNDESVKVELSGGIDKKLDDLSSGDIPEQKKITKKKGRPRKEIPEPVVPFSIYPKEVCKMIAELIPFAIIAILSKDKNFELTNEEKEILAPMWDSILVKRLPLIMGKYAEEGILLSTVFVMLYNKSNLIKSLKEKENEQTEKSA